jgi:hypothetical protein
VKRALLSVLALGAFIVENSFDFVGSVPYFRRLTGGLGILDLLPLPDPERAHRALALLGAGGRHDYAVLLVTFDVLFPLTVALFFRAWLGARWRWLPWLTLALDYAENIACGVLVACFPHESPRRLPRRDPDRRQTRRLCRVSRGPRRTRGPLGDRSALDGEALSP